MRQIEAVKDMVLDYLAKLIVLRDLAAFAHGTLQAGVFVTDVMVRRLGNDKDLLTINLKFTDRSWSFAYDHRTEDYSSDVPVFVASHILREEGLGVEYTDLRRIFADLDGHLHEVATGLTETPSKSAIALKSVKVAPEGNFPPEKVIEYIKALIGAYGLKAVWDFSSFQNPDIRPCIEFAITGADPVSALWGTTDSIRINFYKGDWSFNYDHRRERHERQGLHYYYNAGLLVNALANFEKCLQELAADLELQRESEAARKNDRPA